MIEISEQQLIHVLEDYLGSELFDSSAKFQLELNLSPRYSYRWCITVDKIEDMFEFFAAAAVVFDADEVRELALDAKIEHTFSGYYFIYFPNVKLVK